MRTRELIGPALNWAVRYAQNGRKPVDYVEARDNFSTSWNKGGPIIEREKLNVFPFFIDGTLGGWQAYDPLHLKYNENGEYIDGSDSAQDGTSPLIAAMRCYVASKLGGDVDIPEDLL